MINPLLFYFVAFIQFIGWTLIVVACTVAAARLGRWPLWLQAGGAALLVLRTLIDFIGRGIMMLAPSSMRAYDVLTVLAYCLTTFGLIAFALGLAWDKFTTRRPAGPGFPVQ